MSIDREDFKKAFEGSFSPELIEYIKKEQDKRLKEGIERYTTIVDKLAGTVSNVPDYKEMYDEILTVLMKILLMNMTWMVISNPESDEGFKKERREVLDEGNRVLNEHNKILSVNKMSIEKYMS